MDTETYKDKLIDKLINEFKTKFEEKIGIAPIISFTNFNFEQKKPISLEKLIEYVNTYIPDNLKKECISIEHKKSRNKYLYEIQQLRYIYTAIALRLGYDHAELASKINIHRTTSYVFYKEHLNLLEIDTNYNNFYNNVVKNLIISNLKNGNKLLQYSPEEFYNSESTLCIVLY